MSTSWVGDKGVVGRGVPVRVDPEPARTGTGSASSLENKEAEQMYSSADGWQHAFRGIPAHPAGISSSRIELRVQAIGFASRGWPVVPGTYLQDGEWVDAERASGAEPVPVLADWAPDPQIAPDRAASWWVERPYSLLVATGSKLDALQVDAELGRSAAAVLRELGFPVPIVATPLGSWFFLVAGGSGAVDEPGVRWHASGSWVPMPPTAYPHGSVHWRVKPEVCGWRLPEAEFVLDALRAAGTRNDPHVVELVAPSR
ncbi:bifunctional DNA primase/polymerase [Saccharopolyspora montiporae]